MADLASSTLFEDTLKIEAIDREGKVFQQVSRVEGTTELHRIVVALDLHSDLYPVAVGQHHSIILTSSLSLDAREQELAFVLHQDYSNTLIEKAEYCMHGKIFRHVPDKGNITVSISFGGLLMTLLGANTYLNNLDLDADVYCLMRKL